jgi:hypothetical protein
MIVSFDEYNKKRRDIADYKNKILEMIDEFVKINQSIKKKIELRTHGGKYKNAFDFYHSQKNTHNFVIQFSYLSTYGSSIQNELTFNYQEYQDLLKFMEDPELYRAANKYNL